jgi:hypothetical protein
MLGQAVSYNNAVYISLVNPNLNHTPSSSPANWSVVLSPASITAAPNASQSIVQPAGTGLTVNTLTANGVLNLLSVSSGADIGAKINALIAGCAEAFCPIYIPAGSYAFTTPIVLASNVELFGAGEYRTTLNYTAAIPGLGGPTHTALITTAISAGSSTTKVKLHNFQILGTQEIIGSPVTYNNTQAIALNGMYSSIWSYGAMVNLSEATIQSPTGMLEAKPISLPKMTTT